jgi:hypothetical protein
MRFSRTGGEGGKNVVKAANGAAAAPRLATVWQKPGRGVRRLETIRWLIALGLLGLLFAGIYLFHKSSKSIAALGLPAVLVVVVGFLCWVKAVGRKAEAFADQALAARRGAVAEEDIGSLLGNLPEGFFVVNDFVSGRGNIDHVVISPKGILTIETKSHEGIITSEGALLRRDGRPFEKDLIKQAWAQALFLRALLAAHGILAPKPQPVLLFANAIVQVRRQVRGVEIVSRRYLPAYLKRLHERMDAKEAEKIFEILRSSQPEMFV